MNKPGPVLVIFGITGDLSKRYLLPALYHLLRQDLLPADTKIVGISRRPLDPQSFLKTVELCVLEANKVCDPTGLKKFQQALVAQQLNPSQPADFLSLKALLDSFDGSQPRIRLLYMSVPSEAYGPIVKQFGDIGLNDNRSRLLLEKPFGNSLASAQQLIDLISKSFEEEQIYRIDHYLAKESTQNLLGFRFYNPVFHDIWNSQHISRVTVRATETIGIENRANFYEQTGALRDFIQNHLLQLLAITLMDVPDTIDSASIHQAKQIFLEGLLPAEPERAVRGQYAGYAEEVGRPSNTETYAYLEFGHLDEKWQGATFRLETGKHLSDRVAEVCLEFKVPQGKQPERLVFNIQPKEDIQFETHGQSSALARAASRADLGFRYKDAPLNKQHMDAYERVLTDAIQGDQSLFASDSEVIESWRVLQPVLDAWQGNRQGLLIYEPGSDSPHAKQP